MESAADHYHQTTTRQAERILGVLRTFEALQEQIHLAKIPQHQAELVEQVGDLFTSLSAQNEHLEVPPERAAFHTHWLEALEHLDDAYTSFRTGSAHNFIVAYMQSRRAFSLGKYLLYGLRGELPPLQPYWFLPDDFSRQTELETPATGNTAQTGVMHRKQTNKHAEYSLYVPENYDPSRRWPLVITLHGGHGRGDDYLLTWLRTAKSRGLILLSPKSLGQTWSIQQPGLDVRSILSMLETVMDEYAVNTNRILVSGLSDGGTFSYALGISCSKLFAGIAPIAGVLPPWLDYKQATALPIFIVHGAKDFIFPVSSARMARDFLEGQDFANVTYTELPDWGHAYTYSINETLVLPWFEQLPDRLHAAD